MRSDIRNLFALGTALLGVAEAATCDLTNNFAEPVLANGWEYKLIAKGLTKPRSILFDSEGNLLVIQQGAGLIHLTFDDGGSTCLDVAKKTFLINSTELNHGLALSNDGKTLYASSSEAVFSWTYDAAAGTVGDTNTTLIVGMDNDDHTTRTLLMSQKEPGTIIVSRGSSSNLDFAAESLDSGHSQLKAFDVTALTSDSDPYNFNTAGRLLGWGLRNSVGVAEEPLTGGIYSVENSVDQLERNDVDIHQNNPGEEVNFHGFLNGSTENQGGNYGYPLCYALWNTSIPNADNLTVGAQFTSEQNATVDDNFCAEERVPPRLTFEAHVAPLDIIFLPNGTKAYVSFHGSWDRTEPAGYKVVSLDFSNGSPVAESTSMTAAQDIFANPDTTACPGSCFRPVGLALDGKGRLFVSSDSSGELYVLAKTGEGSESPTSTSPAPAATSSKESAAGRSGVVSVLVLVGAGVFAMALL
ncbi:soluble quino protein glucose/sorbosone dehydrogenase [Cadophora sp. MPI-SDFR-AT-0126]|nr:soluble quino protein glucose/sorbosone dehydrogenase [Leotiomycetes sp. MPI-SDFR-AT-0126]